MRRHAPAKPTDPRLYHPEPTVRSAVVAALLTVAVFGLLVAPEYVVAAALGALAVLAWRRVRPGLQRLVDRRRADPVADRHTTDR